MRAVSVLGDLQAALRGAQALLDAVGDKPIGNPDEIKACADRVRVLAGDAFDAGGAVAQVPTAVAWVGPGADRLALHASTSAAEARSAALELGEIADHLDREAVRVREEQARWQLGRDQAMRRINEIRSAIGMAG